MRSLKGNISLDINKAIENKLKSSGHRYIEGYMTTPALDLENEITDPAAYPFAADEINTRNTEGNPIPLFIEHRRKELSLPIGSVIEAKAKPQGIWFKAEVAKGRLGDPIWELIEQGILRGCSMGGDALETIPDVDSVTSKEIRRIKKMTIRELSLTGLPVNPEAVFSMAKSLNIEGSEVKNTVNKLEKALKVEHAISSIEKAAEGNLGPEDVERIKGALDNLESLLGIKPEGAVPTGQVPAVPGVAEQATVATTEEPGEGIADVGAVEDTAVGVDTGTVTDSSTSGDSNVIALLQDVSSKIDRILAGEKTEDNNAEKTIEEETVGEEETPEDGSTDDNTEEIVGDDDSEDDNEENEEEKEEVNKKMKCKSCNTNFEMGDVDYEVKFCPKCGYDFSQDFEADEEMEKSNLPELDEQDYVELCKYLDEADETVEKNLEVLKTGASEDSGECIQEFEGKNYIKPSTGKRTSPEDISVPQNAPFKKLAGAADEEPMKNYGKDRTKSVDIESLVEKAVRAAVAPIQKSLEVSEGRKGVIATNEKIEKSQGEGLTEDALFAHALCKGFGDDQ